MAPGWPHHIYTRGNNRRRLISYPSDYNALLRCLIQGVRKSSCTVHQLTFMVNHYHSVMTPPLEESLSKLTQRFHQRYAQIRNDQRSASGKLFEERYRAKAIQDDDYLRNVTLYNDTNAYRAGLVTDPFDHAWSTAPIHGGVPERSKIPLDLWTPSPWYLGLGATARQRAERYCQLVYDYLERGAPTPGGAPDDMDVSSPYTRRLQRPNGSSARECGASYSQDAARPSRSNGTRAIRST